MKCFNTLPVPYKNHGHNVLVINGIPDYAHVIFGMRPTQSLSDLMQVIKGDSSKWINQKGFINGHFSWQKGFGGRSYSKSQVNQVNDYIRDQGMHHLRKAFKEDISNILKNLKFPMLKDIFSNRQKIQKELELCL